jgi:uncharacterized protein (TIGR02246 family)
MTTQDEDAIRSLTARFADAVNRLDRDSFAKLWWEDATWELTVPHAMAESGVENVLAMYDRLLSGWAFFVQLVHSGVIEVDGAEARARWSMREFARSESGDRSYDNMAIYDDTLECRNSVWRFKRRRYCYVWVDDRPITGQAFRLPADVLA